MNRITRHYFKTREEFLAVRERMHKEGRLGGSDLGTAAGQNKWKSRRRLYEEMVGNIEVPDISSKQSIKDGVLCEDLVARKFMERTGKMVHAENCVMTSDAAEHLFASIDRKVELEDAGLECKTANAFNGVSFEDGSLPDSYVKQVKTYLKVTGWDRWYVYVWVMGVAEHCYIFTTKAEELDAAPAWADAVYFVSDMELDECEEIAAEFCAMVEAKTPPACDGSEDESKLIKEVHPVANDDLGVTITTVSETDLEELAHCKMCVKSYEAKVAEIENRIKDALGDCVEGMIGNRRVTWKNNRPSFKTDWEAVKAEIPAEIVTKHTQVVPGARVLRIGKAVAA